MPNRAIMRAKQKRAGALGQSSRLYKMHVPAHVSFKGYIMRPGACGWSVPHPSIGTMLSLNIVKQNRKAGGNNICTNIFSPTDPKCRCRGPRASCPQRGCAGSSTRNAAITTPPRQLALPPLPHMSTARYALAAAVLNGRLYVLGGAEKEKTPAPMLPLTATSLVEVFSPGPGGGGTWAAVAPMLTPRSLFGAASVNGKLLVAGGCAGAPCFSAEVFTPSDTGGKWVAVASMTRPRAGHCVVGGMSRYKCGYYCQGSCDNCVSFSDNEFCNKSAEHCTDFCKGTYCGVMRPVVYSIGGAKDGESNVMSSVEKYDFRKDTWTLMNSMRMGRYEAAAAWLWNDTFLYVMGGWTGPGQRMSQTNTVERYDITKNKWSDVAPMVARRAAAVAASFLGKVYIMGGYDNVGTIMGVEVYDVQANKWSPLANMKTPRMYAACSSGLNVLDKKIYVVGGLDAGQVLLASVEVYDPVTNVWTIDPWGG